MYYERIKYINTIKSYLSTKNALILIGARQVGKTSLLNIIIEKGFIINYVFLNGDDLQFQNFSSPSDFLEYLKLKHDILNKSFLIIDEAQRINNIGIYIKYLVDLSKQNNLNLKLIISGSGSLQIFKGITDSLTGRYDLIHVYPFNFNEFLDFNGININKYPIENIPNSINNEIGKLFNLYITYGGYPEVVKSNSDEIKKLKLKNIFSDYIYKDIGFLLKDSEFYGFENFLRLFVSKIGSLIKISSLSEELNINRNLLSKYIEIIKSTFLVDIITPFTGGKVGNEIKKSTKGYILDIGMLNFILGVQKYYGDFKGKIIENFVFNEIKSNINEIYDIHFWQNRNESEVDFIALNKFDKKIILVEAKNQKKDNFPKALLSFIEKYKEYVSEAYITTDGLNKIREINNKKIHFIDYKVIFTSINNIS